jgi:hypothetical protein
LFCRFYPLLCACLLRSLAEKDALPLPDLKNQVESNPLLNASVVTWASRDAVALRVLTFLAAMGSGKTVSSSAMDQIIRMHEGLFGEDWVKKTVVGKRGLSALVALATAPASRE